LIVLEAVKAVHDSIRHSFRASLLYRRLQEGSGIEARDLKVIFDPRRVSALPSTDSPRKAKLYTAASNNGCFVSIDIREANFTALRLLSRVLVDTDLAASWAAFAQTHTDLPFVVRSKRFRQIVIGTLDEKNSNRVNEAISRVESVVVSQLAHTVLSELATSPFAGMLELYCLVSDEAIFKFTKPPASPAIIDSFLRHIRGVVDSVFAEAYRGFSSCVRLDAYELLHLQSVDGYVQSVRLMRCESPNGTVESRIDAKGLPKMMSNEEAEQLQQVWATRLEEYKRHVLKAGRKSFIALDQ
jgi:hypothetical protein